MRAAFFCFPGDTGLGTALELAKFCTERMAAPFDQIRSNSHAVTERFGAFCCFCSFFWLSFFNVALLLLFVGLVVSVT